MDLDPNILLEVIETSGLKYKKSAVSFIFDCPRCQKKDKLYIRRKDGAFICFYCAEIDGFKGRCEYALSELLMIPVKEVKQKLYGNCAERVFKENRLGVKLTLTKEDKPEELKPIEIPEEFFPIDWDVSAKGKTYLLSRGISMDVAKQYGIQYSRKSFRVIFPVSTMGDWYGYQARTVLQDTPLKIITSTGCPRDRMVMFQDRLDGSDHAIICEGPVDALKAHKCGGNIATMGKIVSDEQIKLILSYGVKKIYLALDPDAGEELSMLAQRIGSDVELYHLKPAPGYKDLGEMSMDEVYEQFLKAERVWPNTLFLTLKG